MALRRNAEVRIQLRKFRSYPEVKAQKLTDHELRSASRNECRGSASVRTVVRGLSQQECGSSRGPHNRQRFLSKDCGSSKSARTVVRDRTRNVRRRGIALTVVRNSCQEECVRRRVPRTTGGDASPKECGGTNARTIVGDICSTTPENMVKSGLPFRYPCHTEHSFASGGHVWWPTMTLPVQLCPRMIS